MNMMLSRRSVVLSPLVASFARAEPKISVLVIDGINNHDWQAGTRAIREILEAAGRFRVDVSTTPPREAPASAWDSWRPAFRRYNVVISNFNGGHLADGIRWPQQVEEDFETYLRGGGGFVSYHAANNAFLKWDDYNEIIGLGWRDKSFGPGLIVDENERVAIVPAGMGFQPGHGPRHDFEMTVLDTMHPITKGMPKQWMHPSEQLTHGQHAPANPRHGAVEKEVRVLTYAWSEDSKEREPMDWVRSWERGRVYVTMLGHTWKNEPNPNLEDVNFRTLFARGVEWAASGRVTLPA
jgi:uncharacterized protein